jgi:hypothetical protein
MRIQTILLVMGAGLLLGEAYFRWFAPSRNLFQNPSFEEGKTDWYVRKENPGWNDFEVTSERARLGRHSARLRMTRQSDPPPSRIWGMIQDVEIDKIPGEMSFWYRVENWQQSVRKQYLQAVVMVHGRNILPETGDDTVQLRYILCGLNEPPYAGVRNARYLMAGTLDPTMIQGKWIHFRTNLRDDFLKAWGWLPQQFEKIEFFFEVRYDEPLPPAAAVGADVYWDGFRLQPSPSFRP